MKPDKETALECEYPRRPITQGTKEIYQEGCGISTFHWFGARGRVRAREQQLQVMKRKRAAVWLLIVVFFAVLLVSAAVAWIWIW